MVRREIVRHTAAPPIPTFRQIVRARKGSSSIRRAARSSGAPIVLEGDHVYGVFGGGQPCAQQRGQRPAHVGKRRRPNRRGEKIHARRQAWQAGIPERDRGDTSYPTVLGQIGSRPNPEPITLIDRLDDTPAAGYQDDLPSRIAQQRCDEAACHAPRADKQATWRAHDWLLTIESIRSQPISCAAVLIRIRASTCWAIAAPASGTAE